MGSVLQKESTSTAREISLGKPCADPGGFVIWSRIQIKVGHHRPTSETPFKMAFRWRADDGPTLNAGWVAL